MLYSSGVRRSEKTGARRRATGRVLPAEGAGAGQFRSALRRARGVASLQRRDTRRAKRRGRRSKVKHRSTYRSPSTPLRTRSRLVRLPLTL